MKNTIKKVVLFVLLLFPLMVGTFCLSSCATNKPPKSYNVNVYDDSGNWYETGLLIKSGNKVYVKLSEGQFELIQVEGEEGYTFEIKGEKMYVW